MIEAARLSNMATCRSIASLARSRAFGSTLVSGAFDACCKMRLISYSALHCRLRI